MTLLKTLTQKLALTSTVAALALTAGAALAGDLSGGTPGGLRDGRGMGVPVPAPVPYEETYKYYVGGSVGWAISSTAQINAATTGGESFEAGSGNNFFGPASGGIFVGRYITPSLRVELGMDVRLPVKVASGSSAYTARLYEAGPTKTVTEQRIITLNGVQQLETVTVYTGESKNFNEYNVSHTEKASLMSNTFMFNLVHDFNREGRFNPYLGAGVGFVTHLLHRDATENAKCSKGGNNIDELYGLLNPGTCYDTALVPLKYVTSGSKTAMGVGLAASVQAGVAYKLSERVHWDTGYRLMWMGGKVASTVETSNGIGTTTVSVGNRVDHEIRTGIRFDIW